MKTLSYLLILSLLFLTLACHKEQTPYDIEKSFWPPIEKESDSLVALLNAKAVHTIYDPADTVIANRIDSIGRTLGNNQIRARGLYWKMNAMSRYGMNDRNVAILSEAIQLCDSDKYPYDYLKFRTTFPHLLLPRRTAVYYRLKAEDEFTKCGDSLNTAIIRAALGAELFLIGDTANALRYIEKASSQFKDIGAFNMAVTNDFNLANIYDKISDSAKTIQILDTLRQNSIFQSHNLLRQSADLILFKYNKDPQLLYEALAICDSTGIPLNRRPLTYCALAHYYMDKSMDDSMRYYKECLYNDWERIAGAQYQIYKYMADIMEYENKTDSANIFKLQTDAYEKIEIARTEGARSENTRLQHYFHELQNKAIKEEKTSETSIWIIIAISSATFLIMTFGLILIRKMKIRNVRNLQDLASEQRRSALSQIQVAEKERAIAEIVETVKSKREDVDKAIARIRAGLTPESDWRRVELLFAEINPEFTERLRKLYPTLSPAEHRLACLVYLGLDNKHIARLLAIAPDSVKKTRQRLRAKLPIGPKDDLHQFLDSIVYKPLAE